MRTTIDLDALRAADLSVLVDPMWGAGSGWLSRLLAGGRIRVDEIHQERNPYFGGVNPEPIRPNIDEALGLLAGGGYDLGLLLDGDADRAGAADERGTFVHQLEVTGLLMYYLAEHRGLREPVVVSVNNTSMAARLGRALRDHHLRDAGRLQVHRAEDDRDRRDDGRRGIGRLRVRHAPARARRRLRRPDAARPVPARAGGRALAGVAARSRTSTSLPGRRSTCASTSTSSGRPTRRRSAGCWSTWRPTPPAELAGEPVARTVPLDTGDGFKFFLADGSWLLVRASGTEPLVRIYTEATSAELRDALLVAGERLVRGS